MGIHLERNSKDSFRIYTKMFRLTIMKSFNTEELGNNPFMMSFYIEESRVKPLDIVCGVLPELGERGAAVEAQSADQGHESGDTQTIVSWKVVSVN